jgi:lipopolysaccharide exporter
MTMRAVAKGAAWMVAFRFAERSLGLISTLILARLLSPDDFGLVAMAMTFIALIELINALGFDTALIQHPKPERPQYDTAFTLNALTAVTCALAMVALSVPIANFYREPELVGIVCALSLAWAVQGFDNPGTVQFRRDMQFQREFAFLTIRRVAAFVVTIAAAFWLRSYWALVIGTVFGRVAMVALSYAMHPYRPRFSLAASRELLSFSRWLFLGNLLAFANARLSNFFVGRIGGPKALGLYTVAYEIGTLPTSELLAPINRALIPGFARMTGDVIQLRRNFVDVIGATMLFAFPAAFGIAAVAEPLVRLVLGAEWMEAVPLLQLLAFIGAASAIAGNTFPVYYALGKPKVTTYILALRLAIAVVAITIGAQIAGVIGVAWGELIAALAMLPISVAFAVKVIGVRYRDFLAQAWRPVTASVAMFFAVGYVASNMQGSRSVGAAALELAACVSLGIAVYLVCLLGAWWLAGRPASAEQRVTEFVLARLKSRLHAA